MSQLTECNKPHHSFVFSPIVSSVLHSTSPATGQSGSRSSCLSLTNVILNKSIISEIIINIYALLFFLDIMSDIILFLFSLVVSSFVTSTPPVAGQSILLCDA